MVDKSSGKEAIGLDTKFGEADKDVIEDKPVQGILGPGGCCIIKSLAQHKLTDQSMRRRSQASSVVHTNSVHILTRQ